MRIYWCEELNVPVLDPHDVADRCNNIRPVYVTEPGDVRPAFEADLEIVRGAVEYELGDASLRDLVPSGEVVLLNKIPGYADQADEVIVRGRIVGHRFYDVVEGRWRFRPLYEGVSEILARRRGWWAIVDLQDLPVGYDIHRDRVIEGSLPERRYTHVAISTKDGKIHGVAKLFRGARLHVVKSWRARPRLPEGRPSDMRLFAELNRAHIERKAKEAVEFLSRVFSQYKLPVVVSYSGGKDSLVALDLVARTGHPYAILFNDTGLEAPETYDNVKEVVERYKAELIVASAGDRFWKALDEFGPPARDYRWCCKVIKLAPITKAVAERFPQGIISVVGQRAAESFQRAKLGKISSSRWVARTIVVAPLQDWIALEVWGYIFLHDLPYNKAYERGFDRLGCVVCPANEMAELELVRISYPGIYERLEEKISEHYKDETYLRYGLWRWRKAIPGDLKRFIKLSVKAEYPVRIRRTDRGLELAGVHPDAATALQLLKMLGEVRREGDTIRVVQKDGEVRLSSDFSKIEGRAALDAAALVVRASICGHCDLCISWCPTKALRRNSEGRFVVDESRCIGCLICSKACPSAQYLVYRIADGGAPTHRGTNY
ncbi:phosphoadenosine phosphosulfate reductase [Thermoproteus uzoniensis 768-20]|uniref:Phosphoadenosine phosphosulfate reductase n=1 Tax=Thermoproteus uzoniensis (strain 768-20) TaxID=999630 RepID=F2L497_THEU7|nr:phosphoadenosine phosphosulfate reductase family protein [Thermoproteus uzoniensis]AEA12153.1 phosphoadenosine phosphosulfate reductase [Thermoproteus uzoniensis 768-20]